MLVFQTIKFESFLESNRMCFLFNIVNKYLSSENPLFFELRARYLIACERIPEAMALIKSCINHPEISKDLYFHQALFTCLFMLPVEDQLFRQVLRTTALPITFLTFPKKGE